MTQRDHLVAIVTENVRAIARSDSQRAFRKLEIVMEATGYMSNRQAQTSESIANAIIALAGAIEHHWLVSTASCAVFERNFNRERRTAGGWERATRCADKALASAGISPEARAA